MNDDSQKQFISWLADKLQAKDENDLRSKMQQMGQDGIKQAYNAFMKEQQQSVQQQQQGGKLEYLKCLQAFKKGGNITADCGCGGKMVDGGSMSNKMKFSKESPKQQKDWMIKKKEAEKKANGGRMEASTPKWQSAQGGQNDKGMDKNAQGTRTDKNKADAKGNKGYKLGDKNTSDAKQKKDYMRVDKGIKYQTALRDVPK